MRTTIGLMLFFAVITSAWGFRQLAGQSVEVAAGAPVNDDLLATGNNVTVAGTVNGSAYVAGGTVSMTGPVTGSVAAAGGDVTLGGTKGAVMAAGGTVTFEGLKARNAAIAAGTVSVDAATNIARDLMLTGGDVMTAGTVGRDLNASGGTIKIGGTVNGNVNAAGGDISLSPGTVIRGNFNYESPKNASIAPGARVLGRTTHTLPKRHGVSRLGRLASAIIGFAMMFLLGAVLLAVFRRGPMEVAAKIVDKPGPSLLWGLITLILTPIAAIIVMVTVVGLPLGIVAMLLYGVGVIVAVVITALALGAVLLKGDNMYLQLLLGLVVIYALGAVPFLGGLIWFLVLVFGLGALAVSFRRGPEPVMSNE